jgi:hydrogenase maturation protease
MGNNPVIEPAAVEIKPPPSPPMRKVRDVTILGLGNVLLSDDGVGVHVARHLAMNPGSPEGLRAFDAGAPGFRLMDVLTESDSVLIVDAARLDAPPGAMRVLDRNDLCGCITPGRRSSAHEAGLLDLLTLAQIDGWAPTHLALLGVQPQRVDLGEELSETLALLIPLASRAAIEIALTWQAEP